MRFPLVVLIGLVVAAPALSGERRDHERARAALAVGDIRPLATLLIEVERQYHGVVLDAELERKDGRWVYELHLLPSSGRVFELILDARTGAVLRSRGPVEVRR
ncbi:MAG: peptidase [Alphaproteobacteria bacterium]|nr:peptidase [Alphaproteobacteria bacterium]